MRKEESPAQFSFPQLSAQLIYMPDRLIQWWYKEQITRNLNEIQHP